VRRKQRGWRKRTEFVITLPLDQLVATQAPNELRDEPAVRWLGAIESYLPSKPISLALAYTLDEDGFDSEGTYTSYPTTLYGQIGAVIAPTIRRCCRRDRRSGQVITLAGERATRRPGSVVWWP
jgi:hypothetical protein